MARNSNHTEQWNTSSTVFVATQIKNMAMWSEQFRIKD